MGFADRDYVREKAKRAERAESQRHNHAHDYSERSPWNADGHATRGFMTDLFKLAVLILMAFILLSKLAPESPMVKVFRDGLRGMVEWFVDAPSKADTVQERQVSATETSHAINPATPFQRPAVLQDSLIPPLPLFVPSMTGYTDLKRQVVMSGNNTYRVGNSLSSPIFVRLYHQMGVGAEVLVREFYVLQGAEIALNRLDSGIYVMRYQVLSPDGGFFATSGLMVGKHGNFIYGTVSVVPSLSKLGSHRRISAGEF